MLLVAPADGVDGRTPWAWPLFGPRWSNLLLVRRWPPGGDLTEVRSAACNSPPLVRGDGWGLSSRGSATQRTISTGGELNRSVRTPPFSGSLRGIGYVPTRLPEANGGRGGDRTAAARRPVSSRQGTTTARPMRAPATGAGGRSTETVRRPDWEAGGVDRERRGDQPGRPRPRGLRRRQPSLRRPSGWRCSGGLAADTPSATG